MKPLTKRDQTILPEQKPQAIERLRQSVGGAIEESLKFHLDGLRETADSAAAFYQHLYAIKSKELWRKTEHRSFKDFCEREVMPLLKVPMALSRLYQLADFEEVKAGLPPKVSKILETDFQSRALAKAPKEERAKVLTSVAAEGKVTARAITEKIAETKEEKPEDAEFEEVVRDANGTEVPKGVASEWNRATELAKSLRKKVSEVRVELRADDSILAEVKALHGDAGALHASLNDIAPYVVCPKCKGKKCAVCSKRGFISKSLYKMSGHYEDK